MQSEPPKSEKWMGKAGVSYPKPKIEHPKNQNTELENNYANPMKPNHSEPPKIPDDETRPLKMLSQSLSTRNQFPRKKPPKLPRK